MSTQDTTLPPLPVEHIEQIAQWLEGQRISIPATGPEFASAFRLYCPAIAAQAQQPLESIEQYQLQMAGISAAATGHWKKGDSIHPDYETPALLMVAELEAKFKHCIAHPKTLNILSSLEEVDALKHEKLRQSGLAKLTINERKALGL